MSCRGGLIKKPKRWALYLRDRLTCVYCQEHLTQILEEGGFLTLDHIRPLSRGGTNHPSNLTTACYSCNTARKAKAIKVWWAEEDRARSYKAVLNAFSQARKRWAQDERAYRAQAHLLLGTDGLGLSHHKPTAIALNDERALAQWQADPPEWLAREIAENEAQQDALCVTCNRPNANIAIILRRPTHVGPFYWDAATERLIEDFPESAPTPF